MNKRISILSDLEKKSTDANFWKDQNKAREVIEKANRERAIIKPFKKVEVLIDEVEFLLEIVEKEVDGKDKDDALSEVIELLDQAQQKLESLEAQCLLSGEMDFKNAYLTLHAGAGGDRIL